MLTFESGASANKAVAIFDKVGDDIKPDLQWQEW